MKVIFMGTPDFSVGTLEALIGAGHEVVLVVTQPDKPKGRGGKMQYTPVKEAAVAHGIPVFQPVKIREPEAVEELRRYNADIMVVIAFGQILPKEILDMTPYGCINVHASLLPSYRGAAPIERAILDGEQVTGVTTMYMEKGLDTGDMIDKVEVKIEADDTGATLHDKLAKAGANLIVKTLSQIQDGTVKRTKQDDTESCYAAMLTKEMGQIDFSRPADELERLVRGLIPWPCAYTDIDGKNVKIYKASVVKMDDAYKNAVQEKTEVSLAFAPGEIVEVTKKYIVIACGKDALMIKNLQPEGKKAMDTAAYLNGNPLKTGMYAGRKEKFQR